MSIMSRPREAFRLTSKYTVVLYCNTVEQRSGERVLSYVLEYELRGLGLDLLRWGVV